MSAGAYGPDVPCAHGGPLGSGRIRVQPEDFVVREWLGFAADGEGPHWLLTVRKRDANTLWVARQLARIAGVHPRDVGFAGLKDRNAVAEQAFTVPVSTHAEWVGTRGEGFEVLAAARHRRKLKRGALRGNHFELVVRDFTGDAAALEARMATIAREGVPNYFGPQRFGAEGANLQLARQWFANGVAPGDRAGRGFALSAARAALFNTVLAERVRQGTWNALQAGDVANLDGSGSVFAVSSVDAPLSERCRQLDLHPSGPLWGAGELPSAGAVRALEERVAAGEALLAEGLTRAGLQQERRALRARVGDCTWSLEGDVLRLRFRLTRGAYATAVLHELIDGAFAQSVPDVDTDQ